MTTPEAHIDKLLALVRGAGRQGAFSLTFDDGYADSVAYVASRAPAYPGVQWLVFVCPEKLTRRAGFRWDHYELRTRRNQPTPPFRVFMAQDLDVEKENQREDLHEVAEQPEFQLATVEACKQLSKLGNVSLGGHTNAHFNLCLLSKQAAEYELRTSTAAFEATFEQPLAHFSFPFGHPGEHFTLEHAAYLKALRDPTMWSTHQRPYALDDELLVLPRFAFHGAWSGEAMLVWMSLHTVRARLLRTLTVVGTEIAAAVKVPQNDGEPFHSDAVAPCPPPAPPASGTRYRPASLEAPPALRA